MAEGLKREGTLVNTLTLAPLTGREVNQLVARYATLPKRAIAALKQAHYS